MNIYLEDKKPMINLWRMLKVYIVVTLYVLWFTIHSFVFGNILAKNSTDITKRVCNVITNDIQWDMMFWFFKRLSMYTLFKFPLLAIFWSTRIKQTI